MDEIPSQIAYQGLGEYPPVCFAWAVFRWSFLTFDEPPTNFAQHCVYLSDLLWIWSHLSLLDKPAIASSIHSHQPALKTGVKRAIGPICQPMQNLYNSLDLRLEVWVEKRRLINKRIAHDRKYFSILETLNISKFWVWIYAHCKCILGSKQIEGQWETFWAGLCV